MSTRHLRRLGNSIRVDIPAARDGYTGRECPNRDCLGYFKVTFGTGLPNSTQCVCPYCGTTKDHDHFWTQDQIKYARSVAERTILDAIHKDLRSMEFEVKPPRNSLFGLGVSLKVDPLRLPTLRRYGEKKLETEVVCDRCTLRYAIYGVFGYCPDCGVHNNLGILEANLALVEKLLRLAEEQDDPGLRTKLIENALEDCVSAFDGWGRGAAEVFAARATDPAVASKLSFQNLIRAQAKVQRLFGFDLASAVPQPDFAAISTLFQKRHVLAHRMGVVDRDYIDSTRDHSTAEGRKIRCDAAEVRAGIGVLRTLATTLVAHLEGLP